MLVLRTEHRVAIARINVLLHRSAATPLPAPPLHFDVVPELPTSAEALVSAAYDRRPELSRERAEIEARHVAAELKKLRLRPDFETATKVAEEKGADVAALSL